MNDSIGRILLFVLELCFAAAAVADVTLATGSSLGSSGFVVAKAGDRAVLRCPLKEEENSCPIWTHYSPGYHGQSSGGDRELNDCDGVFSNFSERLSVEKTATASILTITNVKREDAGKYQCEDEDVSIEVIVIDESPKCSSTVRKTFRKKMGKEGAIQTKSKTKLHCKVGFNGSLNASDQCILEWRIVGREDVLINSSKCIVGDNSVKATLTLDAASHSNDTSYVCVVRGSDSVVQNYSCQTGQIETPLTGPMETSFATHENVALPSTDPHSSASSRLQVEQSTDQQTVDDRTLVSDRLTQPPSTKQFEAVQPQIHDIPQQMSEIVQVQKELLVIEKERLRLEKEKISMMATMAASRFEKDKEEKGNSPLLD